MTTRREHDILGSMNIDATALWGIHTKRSVENFSLTSRRVHPAWVRALGAVKNASAQCSRDLGKWTDSKKAQAIIDACQEMYEGKLLDSVIVDPLQGGAGTSLNMNVNEVIANRALQILQKDLGDYKCVSPLDDINYQQSTNDVCPTALKLALISLIDECLPSIQDLARSFGALSKKYERVVKVGRTQFQDAVLTTLGIEFKAYAEVIGRDARRLESVKEALYSVNLGGTAIGTCLGASPEYVRDVVSYLAKISGYPLVQNKDLVDGTQNLDPFALLSSTLKNCATSLMKIAADLRFLSSGPQTGIAEIALPPKQAGSSIMPGKVNPVITEAMSQVCMLILGHDTSISFAVASGNLELNAFLPLIGDCLLTDLELFKNACEMFRVHCIEGIVANTDRCLQYVQASTTLITSMVPLIGYDKACALGEEAIQEGVSVRDKLLASALVTEAQLDAFVSVEAVFQSMADSDRRK